MPTLRRHKWDSPGPEHQQHIQISSKCISERKRNQRLGSRWGRKSQSNIRYMTSSKETHTVKSSRCSISVKISPMPNISHPKSAIRMDGRRNIRMESIRGRRNLYAPEVRAGLLGVFPPTSCFDDSFLFLFQVPKLFSPLLLPNPLSNIKTDDCLTRFNKPKKLQNIIHYLNYQYVLGFLITSVRRASWVTLLHWSRVQKNTRETPLLRVVHNYR